MALSPQEERQGTITVIIVVLAFITFIFCFISALNISKDMLMTTVPFFLFIIIGGAILFGISRLYELLFENTFVGFVVFMFSCALAMIIFVLGNYITARRTISAKNHEILEHKFIKGASRWSNGKPYPYASIEYRKEQLDVKILPYLNKTEFNQYSHVRVYIRKGFFGYGWDILEKVEVNNNE